ncbi:MAG: HAD-IA family hydrolase [Tepidimonas sp.]|uniref:HAD-IA family hydrolase n=1 Tax=Tepidimonas sp. TaxID=2002775 RepID=UPI00298EFA13|nr:HAD-IA family hydrolase [Tepidimonas sp.]MCX7742298.1 HAD-IA family hydrolase [Tepidimonas sp.]MDW8336099.1 HAD-IA family hydrolase [Tepidimonas sp.]
MLTALIFDVDGTLADTERVHLAAFNAAFAAEGLDWQWDEALYTRLLEVSGGKERIRHYWQQVHPERQDIDGTELRALIDRLHEIKTAYYEEAVRQGAVQLRPGVLELIEQARRAGLRLAIATTTSPVNIAALLRSAMGPDWQLAFEVIEDASTAPRKKPHPQVYLQTLARLNLPAAQALALEDSANGLQAARGAGLLTVITRNVFTAHHDFTGALRVLDSLAGVGLDTLRQWHAAACAAAA